ncbi:MAG: SulP family inorganic anion transporter [Saprospiraceae bacterium]|nr:SulP family inorganic anion transporter [Saprospiraceae bacterium]
MLFFLVAVPLCLGIALASGAPLFSGIIAGIIGGIVVGSLSGSPLGVSGPAAGLAVIVLVAINEMGGLANGGFEIFLLSVVLAGVIQVALGYAKAGIIGYYFPSSVIKGMLAGIGVIIILKQIPHAFGYDENPEGEIAFLQPDGQNTFSELSNMLNYVSTPAIIVTLVSLVILILWEQPFMKKQSFSKLIQGPLVVVIFAILFNILTQGTSLGISAEHLVAIPVAKNFGEITSLFSTPNFSEITNPLVYTTAITIAIVASLETLLCVEATDKIDPYKRITPTNKELKAQGIGNIISGLIGGLPITQVIVRSSANIQSGGRTKLSAIIHGVLLLISALAIPFILNLIPLASLAAILFIVGYKLAKPVLFKEVYKLGWTQFIPFIVTILGIVFTDLLIGIGLGLIVAVFYILLNNFKRPYHFEADKHIKGDEIRIELSEEVTFLNKAAIMNTLKELPENSKVIIDANRTTTIDYDVIEIFEDFKENSQV